MHIDLKQFECCGCETCVSICQKSAIKMEIAKDGFRYPVINEALCVSCGLCVKKCPVLACPQAEQKTEPEVWGGMIRDTRIRLMSSSGGIFSALAQEVIRRGGVVFGAVLDKSFSCVHTYTETSEGLESFYGSKYVQSFIGTSYSDCLRFLKAGRLVLFTGTPCQIAGLLSFLGKKYQNLICVDLICHGVPSPALWRKYLNEFERHSHLSIKHIRFRDKRNGWLKNTFTFNCVNKKQCSQTAVENPWLYLFSRDIMLRDSCYQCKFRGENRLADITIADFWGVNQLYPDKFDNQGCSLFLIHSAKGKNLITDINDRLDIFQSSMEEAVKFNPSLKFSSPRPLTRKLFIKFAMVCGVFFSYRMLFFLDRGMSRIRSIIKCIIGTRGVSFYKKLKKCDS